jgi:hypothetical protein
LLLNGFSINTVQLYLTGGSSRAWRLDSTVGALAIVTGIESDPTKYYAGGPTIAPCQQNDVYIFSQNGNLTVQYNGDYQNPANGYSCDGISDLSCTYKFGVVTTSVAGLAQINLEANNRTQWIGVKPGPADPVENVFRILSISPDAMVLRAGSGSTTVWTMKFIRK